MFGIGGDDKDKLKENMEEIKDMVNNSTPQQEGEKEKEVDELEKKFEQVSDSEPEDTQAFDSPPQQGNQQQQQESPADQSFDETFGGQSGGQPETRSSNQSEDQSGGSGTTQSFSEGPASDQAPRNDTNDQSGAQGRQNMQRSESEGQGQETDDTNTAPSSQNNGGDEQRSRRRNQQDTAGQNTEESSSRDSRLNDSIPEPAETKQINVPEIDKGPLFIRRQKFESAKNMIEEMRYISNEIEDVINQLERGIEEDRKTERDAKELLQRLDKDRSDVKGIISSEGEE